MNNIYKLSDGALCVPIEKPKPARMRGHLKRLKAIINEKEGATNKEIELYKYYFIEYKQITKLRGI